MAKILFKGNVINRLIIAAKDIIYKNSGGGLSADNVQDAIDELSDGVYKAIDELGDSVTNLILDKLYPVGSIYLETTNTNPGTKLGGTWEAYGASDTYLRLGGNGSGGSNSATLAANQIPSLTTGNQSQGHTHSVPSTSVTVVANGDHSHTPSTGTNFANTNAAYGMSQNANQKTYYGFNTNYSFKNTSTNGSHSHTATTVATTTGGIGANHTHTYTNSNQKSVSITPKYVQVYAWKRTA